MLAKRLTFVLKRAIFSHKARQKSNIVIHSQTLQFKNWKSNSILLRTYCDQKIWKQQHSQFYLFCSAVVSSCLRLALFNAWLNTFSQTGQSIKSVMGGEPIAGPADSAISHMSNTRNTDMGRERRSYTLAENRFQSSHDSRNVWCNSTNTRNTVP